MSARDLVVTCPQGLWARWLAEGDLPGDPPEEAGLWDFSVASTPREAGAGCRVYVVSHGYLRGYAPLVSVTSGAFVRGGGAVACTLLYDGRPQKMRGFQNWRYATWERAEAVPWEVAGVRADEDTWATYGVAVEEARLVRQVLAERKKGRAERDDLRRRTLAGLPLFGESTKRR